MSLPLHRPIQRAYYSASVREFLQTPAAACLGILSQQNRRFFSTQEAQSTYAWEAQIALLQAQLQQVAGLCQNIYFEFSIPRVGRRVDVLLLLHHHIVLLEFKVGASSFSAQARDQVWDYALDLHHFHASSQGHILVPVVVCTEACVQPIEHVEGPDGIHAPLCIAGSQIAQAITSIAATNKSSTVPLETSAWEAGSYQPSPSILEAALALYQGHQVQDISRSDASGMSLQATTQTLRHIIHHAHQQQSKAICFVTGVPGAGKTLVGLNLANGSNAEQGSERCVYLSGNGPLVDILREALADDLAQRQKVRKEQARQRVNTFIQNIHHFRDECLRDLSPPHEHVAIFDEAQRAWNTQQTSKPANSCKTRRATKTSHSLSRSSLFLV